MSASFGMNGSSRVTATNKIQEHSETSLCMFQVIISVTNYLSSFVKNEGRNLNVFSVKQFPLSYS